MPGADDEALRGARRPHRAHRRNRRVIRRWRGSGSEIELPLGFFRCANDPPPFVLVSPMVMASPALPVMVRRAFRERLSVARASSG